MKATQKLKVTIEDITNIVMFKDLSSKLLPLVKKLEEEGDIYGPVSCSITLQSGITLCVAMSYADYRREKTKVTIFGLPEDEFLAKQYK